MEEKACEIEAPKERFDEFETDEGKDEIMRQKIESEFRKREVILKDEVLRTLIEELMKKKKWDLAIQSISEEIPGKTVTLLREMAQSDPIKSILVQLNPPTESNTSKLLSQVEEEILKNVPNFNKEVLESFKSELDEKKQWDLAIQSISEEIPVKIANLLREMAQSDPIKSMLVQLNPPPESNSLKLLSQIEEEILKNVPNFNKEVLESFKSELEDKKQWDLAIQSISEEIPGKIVTVLREMAQSEPIKNILVELNPPSESNTSNLLSQVEEEILKNVPNFNKEVLESFKSELDEKKQWDLAIQSISEEIPVKIANLLREMAQSDPIKSMLVQLNPPPESNSLKLLSQIEEEILKKVPNLNKEAIQLFTSELEKTKQWDLAVDSISEEIPVKIANLLREMAQSDPIKSILVQLNPPPESNSLKLLSQIEEEILKKVPNLNKKAIQLFTSELEKTKQWDLAVDSISEEIPVKIANLLREMAQSDPIKSILVQLNPPPESNSLKLLSQIEEEILKRVPNLNKEAIQLFMSELEKTKQWDLAVDSISEEIPVKIANLLREMAQSDPIKSILVQLNPPPESNSSKLLSQIEEEILKKVPNLNKEAIQLFTSELEKTKQWDLAVDSISEEIPVKIANLLREMAQNDPIKSILVQLNPPPQSQDMQLLNLLSQIEEEILKRVPTFKKETLKLFIDELNTKKEWNEAVESISEEINVKILNLLREMAQNDPIKSILVQLNPPPQSQDMQLFNLLSQIEEEILKRVPTFKKETLKLFIDELKTKKEWDEAVESISEEINVKILNLLREMAQNDPIKSILVQLNPPPQSQDMQLLNLPSQIEEEILKRVPTFKKETLKLFIDELKTKKEWDEAVESISEEINVKILNLLREMAQNDPIKSILVQLNPPPQSQDMQLLNLLSQIEEEILKRVPTFKKETLKLFIDELKTRKEWDEAVESISEEINVKVLNLLREMAQNDPIKSILVQLNPPPQSQDMKLLNLLSQIEEEILKRVPTFKKETLKLFIDELKTRKEWDEAVESISEEINVKILNLLREMAQNDPIKSILVQLNPPPQSQDMQLLNLLSQIEEEILKRVPTFKKETLKLFIDELNTKKEWDEAVESISEEINVKVLNLLREMAQNDPIKSILVQLNPPPQSQDMQLLNLLSQIEEEILKRVSNLNKEALQSFKSELVKMKQWDLAVDSISEEIPVKIANLLREMAQSDPIKSILVQLNPPPESNSLKLLSQIEEEILKRVPNLNKEAIQLFTSELEKTKQWDLAVDSISEEIPVKIANLLREMAQSDPIKSILVHLNPPPESNSLKLLSQIEEEILKRVPNLNKEAIQLFTSELEKTKQWDLAVESISEEIPVKIANLLREMAQSDPIKSILVQLNPPPESNSLKLLSQIEEEILKKVPNLNKEAIQLFTSELEKMKQWDLAVESISEEIPVKIANLLRQMAQSDPIKSILVQLNPPPESNSLKLLSQIEEEILKRVPNLNKEAIQLFTSELEKTKQWDLAVDSISEEIPVKIANLLREMAQSDPIKSILVQLNPPPESNSLKLLSQIEEEILKRVPNLNKEAIQLFTSELEKTKQWDLAVDSISEEIPVKIANLLREMAQSDPIKSILVQLNPPPESNSLKLLSRIEEEILKRVPNLTKEAIQLFTSELEKTKQWDLAVESISEEIPVKIANLLREMAQSDPIKSILVQLNPTPHSQDMQLLNLLSQIEEEILKRVPTFKKETLKLFIDELNTKKEWDEAVESISEEINVKILNLLREMAQNDPIKSILVQLNPPPQSQDMQLLNLLSQIEEEILKRVPTFKKETLKLFIDELNTKKEWDEAVESISEEINVKILNLLREMAQNDPIKSILVQLNPPPQSQDMQLLNLLSQIEEEILKRVPTFKKETLKLFIDELKTKKEWDEAVESISEEINVKILNLLREMAQNDPIKSILVQLNPPPQSQDMQLLNLLSQIEEEILKRVPTFKKETLKLFIDELKTKKEWDEAVESISEEINVKILNLLREMAQNDPIKSIIVQLNPPPQSQDMQLLNLLSQIEEEILKRVPTFKKETLKLFIDELKTKKEWDEAVESISEEINVKVLNLLREMAQNDPIKSIIVQLNPPPQSQDMQLLNLLSQIEEEILKRVPTFKKETLKLFIDELKTKKEWDEAVESISEEINVKILNLLREMAQNDPIKSILVQLNPPPQSQDMQLLNLLSQIEEEILKRVSNLNKEALQSFKGELVKMKQWDLAVDSISEEIPVKIANLLREMAQSDPIKSILVQLNPPPESNSLKLLSQIEEEILKKVPNLNKEAIQLFTSELEKMKQWDLAVESISEEIPVKIANLLREMAQSDPIKSILVQLNPPPESNSSKLLSRIEEEILKRVPSLNKEAIQLFTSELEKTKPWDLAVDSISEEIPVKIANLLREMAQSDPIKSILVQLNPTPQLEFSPQLPSTDDQNRSSPNYRSSIHSSSSPSKDNTLTSNSDEEKRITLLQEYYEDSTHLPLSAERSLLSLICLVSSTLYPNFKIPFEGQQPLISEQIQHEFQVLKDQLIIEELNSEGIQRTLNLCSDNIKFDNFSQAIEKFEYILKRIRVLNIPGLSRLIKKADEAADLIQNQSVVLFVGGTGAGKSTTILFLAGCKMQKINLNGQLHVCPVSIENPALRSVTSTPDAASETRYINPIPVNFTDVGLYQPGNIILCDTPGFEDTSGPEVDIANGIGIVKAVHRCKGVKIVLLVSSKSVGDRLSGLKDLVHTLVKMIPNIQNHMKAFSYIFTKYSEEEKITINATLKNLIKTLLKEKESDEAFLKFVYDMIDKTQNHSTALNPITDSAADILKMISDGPSITHPDEVFKVCITEKSNSILQEQIRKHQSSIDNALKRHDYDLIEHKLNELRKLKEELGQESVTHEYDDSLRKVGRSFANEYETAVSSLNKCFSRHNQLTLEDLTQYQRCMKRAEKANSLRKSHLENTVFQYASYFQNLKEQTGNLLTLITESKLDNALLTKSSLDKLRVLSTIFKELIDVYLQGCKLFGEMIENTKKSLAKSAMNNNIEQVASELRLLYGSLELLSEHSSELKTSEEVKLCNDIVIKKLSSDSAKLKKGFTSPGQKIQDHLAEVEEFFKILDQIKPVFAQHACYPLKEIEEIYQELRSEILRFFDFLKERVSGLTNKTDNPRLMRDLNPLVLQMEMIVQKITGIDPQIYQSYYQTLERICALVHEAKANVEKCLHPNSSISQSINYNDLLKSILILQESKWVEHFRAGIYSEVIDEVKDKILQSFTAKNNALIKRRLNLENFDKIESAHSALAEIKEMTILGGVVDELKKEIPKTEKWFEGEIEKVLLGIQSTFDPQKIVENADFFVNFQTAEHSYIYVKNYNEFVGDNKHLKTQTDLDSFWSKYANYTKEKIYLEYKEIFFYSGKFSEDMMDKERLNLSEKARHLVALLEERKEIKSKYAILHTKIKGEEFWTQFCNLVRENYIELSLQLQKFQVAGQNQDLYNKVMIAKILSGLDNYIEGEKFSDLYQKNQGVYFAQNQDVIGGVKEAIDKYDYAEAKDKIQELPSDPGYLKKVNKYINNSLIELIEKIRNISSRLNDDLDEQLIKLIVEVLRHITNATQVMGKQLDDEMMKQLNKAIDDAQKSINIRIRAAFEKVSGLIQTNNLVEADSKIVYISKVIEDFGEQICSSEVYKPLKAATKLEKDKHIETINKNLENVKDYAKLPPKEILDNLENTKDANHLKIRRKIELIINEAIDNELNLAKAKDPLDIHNEHLSAVESALKYLPENMNKHILEKIIQTKTNLQTQAKNLEESLARICDGEDPRQMSEEIKNYKSKNYIVAARRTTEKILVLIRQKKIEIQKSFDNSQKTRVGLTHTKKILEYKVFLGAEVPEILQVYTDVKELFCKIYSHILSTFSKLFTRSLTGHSQIMLNPTESLNQDFDILIQFGKFKDSLSRDPVQDFFPENFDKEIAQICEDINRFFEINQEEFNTALKEVNLQLLTKSLKLMTEWESFWMCFNKTFRSERETTIASPSEMKRLMIESASSMKERFHKSTETLFQSRAHNSMKASTCQSLNEMLIGLKGFEQCKEIQIGSDISALYENCKQTLQTRVSNAESKSVEMLKDILEDPNQKKCDEFSQLLSVLLQVQEHLGRHIEVNMNPIERLVTSSINSHKEESEKSESLEKISKILIKIKTLSDYLLPFKSRFDVSIDNMIAQYKSKWGSHVIGKLGAILNKDQNASAKNLIREHKSFDGYNLSLFNDKVAKQDIQYVIREIYGDQLNKILLRKRFDEYEKEYHSLIDSYLTTKIDFTKLETDIIYKHGVKTQPEAGKIQWTKEMKDNIPSLLAHIFALWTLKNSDFYFEAEKQNSYLFKPHPSQIISIFRILNLDNESVQLENNLVQIGTGEGKSVTLAALASIFAFYGYEVSCACYSEYLSRRDYNYFLPLFDSLNITKDIHYGTFHELCERIIQKNGDVREFVKNYIMPSDKPQIKLSASETIRPQILLIDEVDVFFSKDFYGAVYTPTAKLESPNISSLAKLIWEKKEMSMNFRQLTNSEATYKTCIENFGEKSFIIEEAAKDMFSDVKSFGSHDYVVKDDRIGYREQDRVVLNAIYGYKTMFAYFKESEKGKISVQSLNQNTFIAIKCGDFSYAEIPKEFEFIMGVTGTLEALSDPEKQVIKNDYKLQRSTIAPSVFGKNNLKFSVKDDVSAEEDSMYYKKIVQEIDYKLVGRKRAVLVFFESNQALMNFYESREFANFKHDSLMITEEVEGKERASLIKQATTAGQITLLTRGFGRGTDFRCDDEKVKANGGIHVIQTFLSEEFSEEVQIKGRAARQGDPGSYSLVLLEKDLEKFLITKDQIEYVNKKEKSVLERVKSWLPAFLVGGLDTATILYNLLDERRNHFFKEKYQDHKKYVEEARDRHLETQKFLKNIISNNDPKEIDKFLLAMNKGTETISCTRTLVLMDATGSMSSLLRKAKTTVGVMFERAAEILKVNEIPEDSFQVLFAVYRNYNSAHDVILQASPWESKPDNLRSFMLKIEPEGGWGEEAIEIGLSLANKEASESGISQVILIGDAPPNTEADVKIKRKERGEKYWRDTKFAVPTHYKAEIEKLKAKEIPVHAFYVSQYAKKEFEEIGTSTKGRFGFLDIHSKSGAELLTDVVTIEILRSVGQSRGSADHLVKSYQEKYSKSYIKN